MPSGKMTRKPDDAHRAHIAKRNKKAMIQSGTLPVGKFDMRTDGQKKIDALKNHQAVRE